MKKLILFPLLFCLCSLFLISSCNSGPEDQQLQAQQAGQQAAIPELLDRHPDLRQGKEWDQVQSQYVAARDQILEGKDAGEARLTVAQLFINEARVTGEHGHYYPAALQVLDEALDAELKDDDLKFRLLSTKAGILLSLHQFRKGYEIAEEAVKLNPYNSGIYGILVDAHVELGQYEEAVAMADKMVSIRPDLRSYARVSYLREIHGDWEGAIEAMQMAVKAGFPGLEQTAWTRLTLGDLYAEYGDPEQARKQYEIVLANRPDYPFAIGALAKLEMDAGNYEEAEKLLKRAAAIIPEFGFYQDLAVIYKQTGQEAAFRETVDELMAMIADDEASGHRMDLEKAVIYADLLEDTDRALEAARIAYDERPANIDVNRIMADIYLQTGDVEKAKDFLQTASRTNSKKPELLDMQETMAMK